MFDVNQTILLFSNEWLNDVLAVIREVKDLKFVYPMIARVLRV